MTQTTSMAFHERKIEGKVAKFLRISTATVKQYDERSNKTQKVAMQLSTQAVAQKI